MTYRPFPVDKIHVYIIILPNNLDTLKSDYITCKPCRSLKARPAVGWLHRSLKAQTCSGLATKVIESPDLKWAAYAGHWQPRPEVGCLLHTCDIFACFMSQIIYAKGKKILCSAVCTPNTGLCMDYTFLIRVLADRFLMGNWRIPLRQLS